MSDQPGFRSGFVSLLGRPNVGKSTLLNALVGAKLAIVTSKPQTTRTPVQGVWTSAGAQVVFLDTPGIHKASGKLNRRMMDAVNAALDQRDLLLFVADATRAVQAEDEQAVELAKRRATPLLLVLNKIDAVSDKRWLLPLMDRYRQLAPFVDLLPVSALTGEGLDELRQAVVGRLPEGPAYFPEDYLTDQPERFLAAELIREKVLLETRQEVPHSSAVLVDCWEDHPKLTRIVATIFVERPGQKAIVIGAGGAVLKRIGTQARLEIEALLGRRVYLELFVKVTENWRESDSFLNELDWRTMSGSRLTE